MCVFYSCVSVYDYICVCLRKKMSLRTLFLIVGLSCTEEKNVFAIMNLNLFLEHPDLCVYRSMVESDDTHTYTI